MSKRELENLLNFISDIRNILNYSDRLILTEHYRTLKGLTNKEVSISSEQRKEIIDIFLRNNKCVFNENTPLFIVTNIYCIEEAINRDINSVKYLNNLNFVNKQFVINLLLRNNYIISKETPSFISKNYIIMLNSAALDINSVNYFDTYELSDGEFNNIVSIIVSSDYVLTEDSPYTYTSNEDIVFSSIKKDINTIKYNNVPLQYSSKILEYLLINDYPIDENVLNNIPINLLTNNQILTKVLSYLNIYESGNKLYIDRVNKLFSSSILSSPKITGFDNIVYEMCLQLWKMRKNDYPDLYLNTFAKICSILRNCYTFGVADYSLDALLNNMKKVLGTKYIILHSAMKEYYNIYHSKNKDKDSAIQSSKNTISSLCALYNAKSKELFLKEKIEEFHSSIKDYFTPRIEKPLVNKKIVLTRQRKIFKKLYFNDEEGVCNLVKNIIEKYSVNNDRNIIVTLVNSFILSDYSKINLILKEPYNYNEYERYLNASKLVNRLNASFIDYNSQELNNYKDIIKYDNSLNKYVYTGINFNYEEIEKYTEYDKYARIFNMIKKELIDIIKQIRVDESTLKNVFIENIPYNDEYYTFNPDCITYFTVTDLLNSYGNSKLEEYSILNDNAYLSSYNFLINNNVFWFLLLYVDSFSQTIGYDFDSHYVSSIINNMNSIIDLASKLNIDISSYKNIISLHKLSLASDNLSIDVLGLDLALKLFENGSYIEASEEEVIEAAKELVCSMHLRSESTVPFINGKHLDYKYSLYDFQDDSLLLSGINTDACFKIHGNDNDFLHYCALDKNGFVIKIEDNNNNFVGRASGFRNGNFIYINQLRTIYDEGGNGYIGRYMEEKTEIMDTFEKACKDFITLSHNNKEEICKIDYVFTTKSYSYSNNENIAPSFIKEAIGDFPMDNISSDWKCFLSKAYYLDDAQFINHFVTDYTEYPLILVASYKKNNNIGKRIMIGDNKAVYKRKRSNIEVTNHLTDTQLKKINQIYAIKSNIEKVRNYIPLTILEDSTYYIADNWFIIVKDNNIINATCINQDKEALEEYNSALIEIKNNYTKKFLLPDTFFIYIKGY